MGCDAGEKDEERRMTDSKGGGGGLGGALEVDVGRIWGRDGIILEWGGGCGAQKTTRKQARKEYQEGVGG